MVEIKCTADMVDYQSGAVVSREIIRKDTGTVTLFAFDEGQGLSEHMVASDALVHLLDGRAEISIAGQPHMVEKGNMVIMPGGQPHSIQAKERFKMLLVLVR